MTYDQLYEHIVHYVAMPHTTIAEHDEIRACLILGAFICYDPKNGNVFSIPD